MASFYHLWRENKDSLRMLCTNWAEDLSINISIVLAMFSGWTTIPAAFLH